MSKIDRARDVFRFACRLRAKGASYDEAKVLVLRAADMCIPSLDDAEAQACLDDAWKYGAKRYRMTDLGNTKRFVDLFKDVSRYVLKAKKWMHWDSHRWRFDDDGEAQRRARETVELIFAEAHAASDIGDADLSEELKDHALKSQSSGRLAAIPRLAQWQLGMLISADDLDADPMLLGVENCVVDLKTGQPIEPDPLQYITKSANVAYDASAQCPTWEAFLNKIMAGDESMVGFLQRTIGYSLTASIAEQCVFICLGLGANGKSTFLNALRELLGDYAAQTPSSTLMVKSSPTVPNDVARLRGARFVATSEIEEVHSLAEAAVKQMSGGDTIPARFLFSEFTEFVPRFKIWLAANHRPTIKGGDHAIWRRIRLIPFNVTVAEEDQDKQLPNKLRHEFPGNLNWALKGCLQWQTQGLDPPLQVLQATQEYQADMDTIGQWIEECCVITNGASAKASALHVSYHAWAERTNNPPLNPTQLGIRLKQRGFQKQKKEAGNVYVGIGLKDLHSLEGLNIPSSAK
jgi:putative DNA primase/helicase